MKKKTTTENWYLGQKCVSFRCFSSQTMFLLRAGGYRANGDFFCWLASMLSYIVARCIVIVGDFLLSLSALRTSHETDPILIITVNKKKFHSHIL